MTDEALMKNGLILGHFYEAAKQTGRDVWFTSTNDPDQDICRYAKACHFLSPDGRGFSQLIRLLNQNLHTC